MGANPVTAVENDFARLLAGAFRRARWRVHRPRSGGGPRPDLIVEHGGRKYLVEIKRSSEGRRDRLIPVLAQTILEAQAHAREFPEATVPVAVVGAERVSPSVAGPVQEFAQRFAPGVAVGVIDAEGLRVFAGHGLEMLNALPSRPAASQRPPHLFSGLNQWMLKVLLAQWIPADLLSAPRGPFRNASELARAAGVSIMSAFRLVRQLANEGLAEERAGHLEPVRIPELLSRWAAARQPMREFPVRWIVKKDRDALHAALKSYAAGISSAASASNRRGNRKPGRPPRACLALFAAADALGVGFVRGVPPYIYLERGEPDVLPRLGLSAEDAGHNPDAYIRIPANTEAVFRPAVLRDGVPVSDILQVWLDVSAHPSRGRAQAEEIRRRALAPLFGKK
jgi:hypothetical protein